MYASSAAEKPKRETVWNGGKEEEIKQRTERLAGGKKTTGNRSNSNAVSANPSEIKQCTAFTALHPGL